MTCMIRIERIKILELQQLRSNRQLVLMLIFGVIALGSYAFYAIASLQMDQKTESKLDAILAIAEEPQHNVTVIVVPNSSAYSAINSTLGKLSNSDIDPVIIK